MANTGGEFEICVPPTNLGSSGHSQTISVVSADRAVSADRTVAAASNVPNVSDPPRLCLRLTMDSNTCFAASTTHVFDFLGLRDHLDDPEPGAQTNLHLNLTALLEAPLKRYIYI